MNELEGILVAPSDQNNTNKARFIFILEKASLEVAKVGKVQKKPYLYIRLLTQFSYLTYVRFLNIPPQTQGVIFNVAFEFGNKRIAQISWLISAWLVSQLDDSDLSSKARWLGF